MISGLEADAERADHRIQRPAEDALRRRGAGRRGIDPGLQLRQRLLRVQLAVVDVDAQRLLDHAQQLDAAERIDAQVGRESRVGPDGIGLDAVQLGDQALDGAAGCGGRIGPGWWGCIGLGCQDPLRIISAS